MSYELPLILPADSFVDYEAKKRIKDELETITDFEERLDYYNKNIYSLAKVENVGKVYYPWSTGDNEIIKIYCGCSNCRKLPTFNTLAQTGTKQTPKQAILLNGIGSNIIGNEVLQKKAKRKLITQTLALHLNDIADKTGTQQRKKSYWNTYYCQSKLYDANGKLYGKYCKNRFCTLCSSIRKAVLINSICLSCKRGKNRFL